MKLHLSALFLQRQFLVIKFTALVITLLSQTSSANPLHQTRNQAQDFSTNLCIYALSFMDSFTEEFKDTIEVAKIIAFIKKNKNNSTKKDIVIQPIDILLASMTTVVEVDNQTHVVKADLTTGSIFHTLKSLKRGALFLDLQHRIWEEINNRLKAKLKISESKEGGYILTLDKNSTSSFDAITRQNATFDQASVDLLQQTKIESNGNGQIDPKHLLLAMVRSNDLHFISELAIGLGLFDRLLNRHQRQPDKITSNTSKLHEYTSILQLRILQNNGNETQQLHQTDAHLLSKVGFSRRIVRQLTSLIESNNFEELRIKIKKHILRNTSSEEIEEVERLNNTDIEVLVNENDIRNFLKYRHNFTDEESELFIQKFIRAETTQIDFSISHLSDHEVRKASTTPMSQQRQELIDRLRDMDQNELEVLIRSIGFEINNGFINHLMDPKKVPQNIKQFFLRFIADVQLAGSISNMRTSSNFYGFKKIRVGKRNKRSQRQHYYSLHLASGDWVVVLKKEGDIFVLHQIMPHNTYSRHF